MLLKPFTLHSPESLSEAVRLYADLPDVRLLAGGTFLLNNLKTFKRKGVKTPAHLVSLRRVKDLEGVACKDGMLTIKAMTRVHDLTENVLLTGGWTVLRDVCRGISTCTIRNMATIGGNLTCRYTWTELGSAMVALKATLHFTSAGGEHVVSAENFFQGGARAEGILTHIVLPDAAGMRASYQRVKKSPHVDVPLLALCLTARLKDSRWEDVRVCVNNGFDFVRRDAQLEGFLNGQRPDPVSITAALEHLDSSIYDTRSDDYKKHMFRVSLTHALKDLTRSV